MRRAATGWPGGLALLALAGLLAGCAAVYKSTVDKLDEDAALAPEHLTVASGFERRAPRTVAVLPLANETEDPEAPEIVRRLFFGGFSALPFRDVELSTVDAALGGEPPGPLPELAKRLGADGLVRGRVITFERNYYALYADLRAVVEFELVSAASEEVLWRARSDEVKHKVSLSLSPLGIAMSMASNAVELSRMALIRTAADACRRAVNSIPVPPRLGQRPVISEFLHGAAGRTLRQGERLEAALQGTPGLKAAFTVPGVRDEVPMKESGDAPGQYRGTLMLPDGLETGGLTLTASLSDDRGETARWVDVLGPVRLDTRPPAAPSGLKAVAGDRHVELSWAEGGEKDLALYRVLRSDAPLQGYAPVGDAQTARFLDESVANGRPYYYKVTALDAAGNGSDPSGRVQAVPVAPGPRVVGGVLAGETFWARAGGPYVLEGEVTVPRGATLTVEAGTTVRGRAGSALRVAGRLVALGEEADRIAFAPVGPERWAGVSVEGPGGEPSALLHVRIEGADVGLAIRDASPRVERLRVLRCGTGVAVEGVEAAPKISRAVVQENDGPGLAIRSLAAPTVVQGVVSRNRGPGVRLEGGGGVLFRNEIAENGGGIAGRAVNLKAGYNRVTANQGFELNLEAVEQGLPVLDLNYWGHPDTLEAASSVAVPRGSLVILRAADSESDPLELPLLDLPAPEGIAGGLWVRRLPYLTQVDARVRPEKAPFVVGVDALEAGDAASAAAAFEKAAAASPDDPEAHFWLGVARLASGRAAEALEPLQRACLLSVANAEYRRQLAEAYLAAGRAREAELTFQEVLRLDPADARAREALGGGR